MNLNEAGFLRRQFESLTWEIKGCSKVVVKQNFLSAIFNSGNKLKLYLKFSDVPNLVIHEAAFTVTGMRHEKIWIGNQQLVGFFLYMSTKSCTAPRNCLSSLTF